MKYCDQKFKYNKKITVTQQCKNNFFYLPGKMSLVNKQVVQKLNRQCDNRHGSKLPVCRISGYYSMLMPRCPAIASP